MGVTDRMGSYCGGHGSFMLLSVNIQSIDFS